MRIFYSWQSDCPDKTNKYFIKEALDGAIKELKKTLLVEEAHRQDIQLDHDTKGVPGTPDIAAVVFEKVSSSDIFVGDLSMPFKATSGKLSPNPNVLLEYGYAFGRLGPSRIIGVMNNVFGEGNELPFDIRHRRHPIAYSLSEIELEDKDKKKLELKKLEGQIMFALSAIIGDIQAKKTLDNVDSKESTSLLSLKNKIMASDPIHDWQILSENWETIAVYRDDVNLRVHISYEDEGIQQRDFKEEWANAHLDRNATGYWCDIYYGNTRIFKEILVSVDGGRAMLPIPKVFGSDGKERIVEHFNYKLAQIFDTLGNLDQYLFNSGLTIEDQ